MLTVSCLYGQMLMFVSSQYLMLLSDLGRVFPPQKNINNLPIFTTDLYKKLTFIKTLYLLSSSIGQLTANG